MRTLAVIKSMAPGVEANMFVLAHRDSKYALDSEVRVVECIDGTSAVVAEVFETGPGQVIAVFIRYSYDPAYRTQLIYG